MNLPNSMLIGFTVYFGIGLFVAHLFITKVLPKLMNTDTENNQDTARNELLDSLSYFESMMGSRRLVTCIAALVMIFWFPIVITSIVNVRFEKTSEEIEQHGQAANEKIIVINLPWRKSERHKK